jgi:hypothetical protein
MEGLLAEVGAKFVPRPLERLLAVVTALLHRCKESACLLACLLVVCGGEDIMWLHTCRSSVSLHITL